MEQSRMQWMRQEATNIFELTKGHIPEQIDQYDNAMKSMLDMAGFVLELTNEQPSPSPVEESNGEKLADKWVFETNGHKWSNNDNTAGDNYGSFLAGFKAGTAATPPQNVKGMRWRPGGDAPEDAALFHSAHWRRVEDKKPILPVGLNHEGNFIAQFGKVYELHQVEWLCEDEYPSDTLKVDAVAFGKWLKHLDNGTSHYNPETGNKTDSIGYSPFDCFVDGTLTIEQLYDLYIQRSLTK